MVISIIFRNTSVDVRTFLLGVACYCISRGSRCCPSTIALEGVWMAHLRQRLFWLKYHVNWEGYCLKRFKANRLRWKNIFSPQNLLVCYCAHKISSQDFVSLGTSFVGQLPSCWAFKLWYRGSDQKGMIGVWYISPCMKTIEGFSGKSESLRL